VPFEFFKGFPSEFDTPVVDLLMPVEGGVEVPMRVCTREGQLRLLIYSPEGSVAWDYPLHDVSQGLERAADLLSQ
jgi:hypothetical protein